MLNDPAGTVSVLPSTRAYERTDLDRLIDDAERFEARLRLRLEAARRRRVAAEAVLVVGPSREDHDRAVALAHAALDQRQREHEAAIAELHRASAEAAARLLRTAEDDALEREHHLLRIVGLLGPDQVPDAGALGRPGGEPALDATGASSAPVPTPFAAGAGSAPVRRPDRLPPGPSRRRRELDRYARSTRLRRQRHRATAHRSGR